MLDNMFDFEVKMAQRMHKDSRTVYEIRLLFIP